MDRFEEIKLRWRGPERGYRSEEIGWLISEVESLRDKLAALNLCDPAALNKAYMERDDLRQQLAEHGPCHGPEDCPEAGLQEQIAAIKLAIDLDVDRHTKLVGTQDKIIADLQGEIASSREIIELLVRLVDNRYDCAIRNHPLWKEWQAAGFPDNFSLWLRNKALSSHESKYGKVEKEG